MKQTKLTILGYFVGALVIVASVWRWTLFYSDLKQTLIGAGMGFMILGFAYLYQRVTELRDEDEKNLKDLEEDLDGLGRGLENLRIWTVDTLDKLKK